MHPRRGLRSAARPPAPPLLVLSGHRPGTFGGEGSTQRNFSPSVPHPTGGDCRCENISVGKKTCVPILLILCPLICKKNTHKQTHTVFPPIFRGVWTSEKNLRRLSRPIYKIRKEKTLIFSTYFKEKLSLFPHRIFSTNHL